MQELILKATILVEALPYIKEFYNQSVVIKYGGSAMENQELKKQVLTDIALMKYVGIKPVIVHGGGKHITNLSKQLGKEAVFLDGHRITDQDTMDIIEMVLSGLLNKDIVSQLNLHGVQAVGISGRDANLLKVTSKGSAYGFVGDVSTVNPKIIRDLEESGYVPVISPVGTNDQGEAFNVNADVAAAEIAKAIQAKKLVFLTDVDGLLKDTKDPSSLISSINTQQARNLIKDKIIDGGMIPKIAACIDAIENGVGKVHMINGKTPHSVLLEIFTKQGIGTQITRG